MTGSLPSWVDLGRAPARSQWTATVPADKLPRLADAGLELAGQVHVELDLRVPEYRSDQVPATASGRIVAQALAQCQRCLGTLTVAVDEPFEWALLDSDVADDGADAEPVLLRDGRFEVMDAITDQILLAMPAYPRHAQDCVAGGKFADTGPGNGPDKEN